MKRKGNEMELKEFLNELKNCPGCGSQDLALYCTKCNMGAPTEMEIIKELAEAKNDNDLWMINYDDMDEMIRSLKKELAEVKEILFEQITNNSVMVIKDSGDEYTIKKQDLVKLLKGE